MIIIGAIIAGAGWFFLLDGVGVGTGVMQVANLHLISIANNVILLGYFLMITGVVRAGFNRLPAAVADADTKARKSFSEDMEAQKAAARHERRDPEMKPDIASMKPLGSHRLDI